MLIPWNLLQRYSWDHKRRSPYCEKETDSSWKTNEHVSAIWKSHPKHCASSVLRQRSHFTSLNSLASCSSFSAADEAGNSSPFFSQIQLICGLGVAQVSYKRACHIHPFHLYIQGTENVPKVTNWATPAALEYKSHWLNLAELGEVKARCSSKSNCVRCCQNKSGQKVFFMKRANGRGHKKRRDNAFFQTTSPHRH